MDDFLTFYNFLRVDHHSVFANRTILARSVFPHQLFGYSPSYRYLTGKETVDGESKNIAKPEMSDNDYRNFMIWHRGLAVPAARNLDDPDVARGHDLFRQIGCAACPSKNFLLLRNL